jgi:hypothetical protein
MHHFMGIAENPEKSRYQNKIFIMAEKLYFSPLVCQAYWGGDDDGGWDDSTMSEQGNGQDSDNLPDWQQ